MSRFACVRVPFFVAAAAERCEPGLRERALAIVTGIPPATRVVDANAAAREHGVAPGMTEAEARARARALVSRPAAETAIVSARAALLDALFAVSPRLEDAAPGVVHVDATGLDRLIGDAAAVAARLARTAAAVGLPARIGMASTRTAARVAASVPGARVTIVPAADPQAWLASLPVEILELPGELPDTVRRWGISTLGELAALPREGLADRLGVAGLQAHDAARGVDREPFRPYVPPPFWEEAIGLEWGIESLTALAHVLDAVLDRLCARLVAAGVAADAVGVDLPLVSGARHQRTISLAYPLREPRSLSTLLTLDLEAHPPPAPVTGVTLTAHAVITRAAQGGLWQPPTPALRDLAAAVARLARLVGPHNIGSPIPSGTHRPDDFTLAPFMPTRDAELVAEASSRAPARLVLRRLRPPRRVDVKLQDDRPARMNWDRWQTITRAAGPWRVSGEWWDVRAWTREEWDVALADGTLCRLAREGNGEWVLDAVYD